MKIPTASQRYKAALVLYALSILCLSRVFGLLQAILNLPMHVLAILEGIEGLLAVPFGPIEFTGLLAAFLNGWPEAAYVFSGWCIILAYILSLSAFPTLYKPTRRMKIATALVFLPNPTTNLVAAYLVLRKPSATAGEPSAE